MSAGLLGVPRGGDHLLATLNAVREKALLIVLAASQPDADADFRAAVLAALQEASAYLDHVIQDAGIAGAG